MIYCPNENVPHKTNFFKKIMSILISLIVIVISFMYLHNVDKNSRDTVIVAKVSQEGGINAFSTITEDNIEKYALIRKEYTEDMVHWDNGLFVYKSADGTKNILQYNHDFAAYYIRNGTILYGDQLTDKKQYPTEWLYDLPEGTEVVTIPYEYMEAGGNILLPGDRIRIRLVHEENEIYKSEILFESIVVKDILNSNGNSILAVYNEVLTLNEAEREEFIKNIHPSALMLCGTKKDIDNYAIRSSNVKENAKLFITILNRDKETREVILN
ncbi:MAG: flagellar biosynthesis protein FlgA [Clostridiales bacterium]|jgi:predicted nucleic acid-binding protein|nr:flagellar biosynthesis protein FlgA [Clostridiales bacterium]